MGKNSKKNDIRKCREKYERNNGLGIIDFIFN
jgi:hypothetical protein